MIIPKKLATPIFVGFAVKSATPIDTRDVAETIVEMKAIENPYEGMKTFCLEDDVLYVYRNGKYKPYSSGGTPVSSAFTYTLPLTLSASNNTEEDFLTR